MGMGAIRVVAAGFSPGSPHPARAEPRRCAQDTFVAGQRLRAGMSARLGLSIVVCICHLSPHAWAPVRVCVPMW